MDLTIFFRIELVESFDYAQDFASGLGRFGMTVRAKHKFLRAKTALRMTVINCDGGNSPRQLRGGSDNWVLRLARALCEEQESAQLAQDDSSIFSLMQA
jgi:hypothetical protein